MFLCRRKNAKKVLDVFGAMFGRRWKARGEGVALREEGKVRYLCGAIKTT